MKALISVWICVFSFIQISNAATELLANPDMESVDYNGNWKSKGSCTLTSSTDSYSGNYSIMVTNRETSFHGISQYVDLIAKERYNMTAYIKLLPPPEGPDMFEQVELKMNCKDAANESIVVVISRDRRIQSGDWTKLGGVKKVPNGAHTCHVYVQVTNPALDYLIDHASLQNVPVNNNWRAEANARIENIRKADISISLTGNTTLSYKVKLEQQSHDFAFGNVAGEDEIVDPIYAKYQEVFYDNNEWGVLGNKLKWLQMEKSEGDIDYDTPLKALRVLKSNGIKIRGHHIFGAPSKNVNPWVKALSKEELIEAMSTRINYIVNFTKGIVEHWDVNNEDVHGDWYERATGNPNITMDMFREAQSVDPDVKLFLNDFGIMENLYTVAYQNQAKLFKASGTPIYGVGIQSHIKNANIDITTLAANLETIAEAKLPIWITELSVLSTNETEKASALTDLLTLYFSHPSVEGTLLWGFWEGKIFDQEATLYYGDDVTPNAAGQAYHTLYKTTWTTKKTRTLDPQTPLNIRGFLGNYTITVKQNKTVVSTGQFHLGKSGQSINVNVGSTTEINFV